MTAVARLGDVGSGHDCFPARQNDQGSPNVFVNGIPLHRQGDHWTTHCCPDHGCHDSVLAAGCPTVYANNLQVGRIGDPVACGSVVVTGSVDVFAG